MVDSNFFNRVLITHHLNSMSLLYDFIAILVNAVRRVILTNRVDEIVGDANIGNCMLTEINHRNSNGANWAIILANHSNQFKPSDDYIANARDLMIEGSSDSLSNFVL